MATAARIALLVLLLAAPGPGYALTFTIQPALSTIQASATVLGFPVVEQAPGSLLASIQGTIEADPTVPGLIAFGGGSALDPVDQAGPFVPGGTGGDYAGCIPLGCGTIRGLVIDLTSVSIPVLGTSFDATLLTLAITAGVLDNTSFLTPYPLASVTSPNFVSSGRIEIVGGVYELEVPIYGNFEYPPYGVLSLIGRVTAWAPVPEPGSAALVTIGVAVLAFRRRLEPTRSTIAT